MYLNKFQDGDRKGYRLPSELLAYKAGARTLDKALHSA